MKTKAYDRPKRVHRSVNLDAELVGLARSLVPPELSDNLNRIVNMALAELVEKYSRLRFEKEMRRMGQDPALMKQSDRISAEFRPAESDGL